VGGSATGNRAAKRGAAPYGSASLYGLARPASSFGLRQLSDSAYYLLLGELRTQQGGVAFGRLCGADDGGVDASHNVGVGA